MIRKIFDYTASVRSKIILLLGGYIVLTELIKSGAEIYILEQSLELKLILFSLALVLLYNISNYVLVISIILFIFLSLFGLPTGFMVYIFVMYYFLKQLKTLRRSLNE